MILELVVLVVAVAVAFGGGVLFGKANPKKVAAAVSATNTVVADATAAAKKL